MEIHQIRQQLKQKTIYDIPLRVTYYARVSSESDEQLNSLGNQIRYYEDYIRRTRQWQFVPGYIDEGLSGISTKKRESFLRMVDDAADGRFDLVITKEISRFARNTMDSIRYTRQLLNCGVGVFFQNDNINTFDEDAELRLSIMSSIAQDELRKLSSRVRFGHQQAIRQKVVLGNSRIYGYEKDNKRLIINEAQAAMVRTLFELYATGRYSMKQLEALLYEQGYRNLNGNRIAHSTMANMIANPKYKGYYVGNKVKIVDMFTKKQEFLPQEDWVMFKDESGEIVPAIVSEALWEAANRVLRRRSADVKQRQGVCNHANLLTGKLWCTHCGTPYYRRESRDKAGNQNSKWVCAGKIANGAASCPSIPIYERELKPLLFEVFQQSDADADALAEEYLRMYRSLREEPNLPQRMAEQKTRLALAEKKKGKLLELAADGCITNADFRQLCRECDEEAAQAAQSLSELERQGCADGELRKSIERIRAALHAASRDVTGSGVNAAFVSQYIDRIEVTPEADGKLRLGIRIFSGEETDQFLEPLRASAGRAGHMFKKMIEAYENQMK